MLLLTKFESYAEKKNVNFITTYFMLNLNFVLRIDAEGTILIDIVQNIATW